MHHGWWGMLHQRIEIRSWQWAFINQGWRWMMQWRTEAKSGWWENKRVEVVWMAICCHGRPCNLAATLQLHSILLVEATTGKKISTGVVSIPRVGVLMGWCLILKLWLTCPRLTQRWRTSMSSLLQPQWVRLHQLQRGLGMIVSLTWKNGHLVTGGKYNNLHR